MSGDVYEDGFPQGSEYLSLPEHEPWMDDALCAQTDPEIFFPQKGGSTRPAKSICNECPVRAECLEYALRNNEQFGIWGGVTERNLRKIRRAREAA